MEYWGIYVAFAWLAVLVYASAAAVYASRKQSQLHPLPAESNAPDELEP